MKTLKPLLLSFIILISVTQVRAQTNRVGTSISEVTESYLAVKTALEAEDGTATSAKAKELLTALKGVPSKRMTSGQLMLWTKYFGQLIFDTRHISEVDRVHYQKEHFKRLTKNLHTILEGFKMNKAGI